jgi:hypothetical protein
MTLLASNYENDPIDVLVGDWMSEGNMTGRAHAKVNGTHQLQLAEGDFQLNFQASSTHTNLPSSKPSSPRSPTSPSTASKLP